MCVWSDILAGSAGYAFCSKVSLSIYSMVYLMWTTPKTHKLAHPGEDAAPKRCTVILYSRGSIFLFSGSVHPPARRTLGSCDLQVRHWTGGTSFRCQITATASLLKQQITPTKELIRSGPVNRVSFRAVPHRTSLSNRTRLSLPGFLGLYTPWCGGAGSASPFRIISSMKAM